MVNYMAFHFRQNLMFHFTLNFAQSILHFVFVIWVWTRDSTFAFNIQLRFMQHSSFRFRHSTFHKQQSSFLIRLSSWVECTFICLHPTFTICPLSFRFWHPTLGIALASFRIRHSSFRIGLFPLVSDRWRSWAQLTWPTPAQMVVESRLTDFLVEWTRETFSTPDKPDVDRPCSQQCDNGRWSRRYWCTICQFKWGESHSLEGSWPSVFYGNKTISKYKLSGNLC